MRIMIYTGPTRVRAVRVLEGGTARLESLSVGDAGSPVLLPEAAWPRMLRAGDVREPTPDEREAVLALLDGDDEIKLDPADNLDTMTRAELWRRVQDRAGDALPFGYVGTTGDQMREWLREAG